MMMMDLTFEECVSSTSSTSSIGNSKLFQMLDDDLSSIPCSASSSSSGSSSNSSTRLDDNMILSSFPSSPISLENHHHHHHNSAGNLTPSFDFDYKGDEFNQQFEFIDDLFLLNSDTCLSANHQPNENNINNNTSSPGNNNRCCNNNCCVNNNNHHHNRRGVYCCNNNYENSLNSSFASNFSSSLSHTSNINSSNNNQHVAHNSSNCSNTPQSASSSLSSNEFGNHLMDKCNISRSSGIHNDTSSSTTAPPPSSSPSLLVSYLNNPINHHHHHHTCCKNQNLCSNSNNTQIKVEDLPTTSSTPSSATNNNNSNIFQVVNPTEINQRTFMMPVKTEPLLCDSKARSQLDDGINTANNSITKIVTSTSCNKKIINLKTFKSDPRAMRNSGTGGGGSGGGGLCYTESIKRCKLGPSLLTNSPHQQQQQQQQQLDSFQNVIKVIKQDSSQDMSSIGNTQCFDNSEDHGVCSTKKKMFKTCNGGASSVLFSSISQNTPNGDSLFSSTIVNNKSKINVIKITPSLKENSNISGKEANLALLNGLSSSTAASKTHHTSSGFLSDANSRHQTGGSGSYSALNGITNNSISNSYANVNSPSNKIYPKPSFSYSCLIAMAMRNCDTGHLPVNDIYEFIVENFPYYKTARDGWKNSIRHNLSLNKCFRKIENPISGSKKGCLWALNPEKSRKLEEECRRCIQRDLVNIRLSMKRPDELGDIERGEQRLAKKIGGGGSVGGGSTNSSTSSSGASSLTASPKCASPVNVLHHQLPPMSRIIENGVLKFTSSHNSNSISYNNSSNSGDFLSQQQDVKFDR